MKRKRRYPAIQIFIDYMERYNRMPTKTEFDEIWQGAAKYYYEIKNMFLADMDFYMGKEE